MAANQPPTSSHIRTTSVDADSPSQKAASRAGRAQVGTQTKHVHLWLVIGPAGCGKTTVASHLSRAMSLPYVEGDELHPLSNVEKMTRGIPLTDEDRWDWLTRLREECLSRLASSGSSGVVVTCSALKRKYRDVIRVAKYYNHNVLLHFILLDADEKVLVDRVMTRRGHFMGADMVKSQLSTLEKPGAQETDVIVVDAKEDIEEVNKDVWAKVQQALGSVVSLDSYQPSS